MATKVEKSIVVDVPERVAYDQWTQFEEFPQFMGGVSEVKQLDDTRLHWVAEIGGVKREWNAEILEQIPDRKVAWAATSGATNAGAVFFEPAGAGKTTVRLELEYEPEGLIEKAGDAIGIVGRRAEADLEKFKEFIEAKGAPTGAWRGDVQKEPVATPGVEAAESSRGDSGKAGISGKAAGVAGAAAAAAGAAAAKALKDRKQPESEVPVEETVVVEEEVVVPPPTTGGVPPTAEPIEPLEPAEPFDPAAPPPTQPRDRGV